MPVSFYALVTIIVSSFILTLLPFAGFPYSWDRVLTAVFGSLIFGVSAFSLYRGYVRIIARLEKQERSQQRRVEAKEGVAVESGSDED